MADLKQPESEQQPPYSRQIQHRAIATLQQRKGDAADWLADVAQSMRDTGQVLHEREQPTPGQYAQQAAEQVDRLADYVRHRDVEQLRGDAEQFIREHPALVLGGALAVGLMAARLLRSGAPGDGGEGEQSESGAFASAAAAGPPEATGPEAPSPAEPYPNPPHGGETTS